MLVDRTDRGGVARLTLCHEERRNATSVALLGDLEQRLAELESDDGVHVVALTGRGRAFSVGADLAAPPEQRWLRRDAGDLARLRHAGRIVERLHQLPQVTVGVIDGGCAGAGLALALACDVRIATPRAVLNTAFLTVGLPGDLGGIWFATRALGTARARELFLLPEKLDATAAARAGLVSSVSDDAETVLRRLAGHTPAALRAMKQNLTVAATAPLPEYLRGESERMVACFDRDEAHEAAQAFLGRRSG